MENKNINLLKYEFSLIPNKYSRLDILAIIFIILIINFLKLSLTKQLYIINYYDINILIFYK